MCIRDRNIICHPEEEKYKEIRVSNRGFQDKVQSIEGAVEFLEAAGFLREKLVIQEHAEEFLRFSSDRIKDITWLQVKVYLICLTGKYVTVLLYLSWH